MTERDLEDGLADFPSEYLEDWTGSRSGKAHSIFRLHLAVGELRGKQRGTGSSLGPEPPYDVQRRADLL